MGFGYSHEVKKGKRNARGEEIVLAAEKLHEGFLRDRLSYIGYYRFGLILIIEF